MFDRVARRYDILNDVLSLGQHHRWRQAAAREARVQGSIVLDLAAGTGDLAIACRRCGASRVVGVDFSSVMLEGARKKLSTLRLTRAIDLVQADALALPFADATFDVVASAFLLRNLPDLEGGLAEMRRVLRRGGRVVALDIAHPPPGILGMAVRWYFHTIVPGLGGVLTGEWDAYRYLPRSIEPLPAADRLATMFERAGFHDVVYQRLGLGSVAMHSAEA